MIQNFMMQIHHATGIKNYEEYIKIQLDRVSLDPIKFAQNYINWAAIDLLDRSKSKILDIGCGNGAILSTLITLGFNPENLYGVDINEEKLKTLGINNIFHADMHDLSFFKNDTFDYVVSTHSLEHALDPIQVLNELKRVVKSDGKILIVIPYPEPDKYHNVHVGKFTLKTDYKTSIDDREALNYCDVLTNIGFKINKKYIEVQTEVLGKYWNIKHNPHGRQNEIWTVLSK